MNVTLATYRLSFGTLQLVLVHQPQQNRSYGVPTGGVNLDVSRVTVVVLRTIRASRQWYRPD